MQGILIVYYDNGKVYIALTRENLSDFDELQELAKPFIEVKQLNNLHIVTYNGNDFDVEQLSINSRNVEISSHYNNDFIPVAEKIERFLEEDNHSGLVILHGKQGTGKTTYIRHLINKGNRKYLYIGADLVDKLSSPSFISFVRTQKNAVFIIEDCEELLVSRNNSRTLNNGLINILNMSDGLLSDCLGIKFICTFNAPLNDIDMALLRKGRLVVRYEFSDLCAEKVNRIIRQEKLDIPEQTKSMSLADLFNSDENDFKTEKNNRIGFIKET